jgi:hypothetical protein
MVGYLDAGCLCSLWDTGISREVNRHLATFGRLEEVLAFTAGEFA